jgi:hypothetical protein
MKNSFLVYETDCSMSKCHYSFGRGRRPRGLTFARGTIRSLLKDLELARQRTAHDVATRSPCRNLFRDAHFEIIQFCLCRHVSSFLVYRFRVHFLFIGSLSVSFVFLRFHSEFFVETVPANLGWLEPHMRAPKF